MKTRTLLVDDEAGIRRVLTIALQDAGYDVTAVDDGKKAAALVDQQPFDIVLTDISMPGMNGIALLTHIKKHHPETEVIMITGHGDYQLAIESLKLDAVDFIPKPIDNDVLDIALKRARDKIDSRKKILDYTKNLEGLVKEKTRKLAESEKRYVQLFNETPSYLTIQDKNLQIVETNKIFKEHFNYKEKTACYEVYKGRNTPCVNCPVKKTFKDGNSHTAEMDVFLKDGSKRNIFIQTSGIKDAKGRTTHVMEMSTDVTMIHELQDHLASLGLHIGSVSHGLKQLVTGLDGGAYLIDSGLKKNDIPQISEGWDIVKGKLKETRQMVMNILYHTKKREPDLSQIPVSDLVRDVAAPIRSKAVQEHIEFITDFPETGIQLQIDRTAIFAAFRSILENALDACLSADKKGRIDFSFQIKKQAVVFEIRDSGKGIKPGDKDKIFDLFYSDKGNKGTGLGLFIASRSIKQHGGTIAVDSKEKEFTRFTITLPIG